MVFYRISASVLNLKTDINIDEYKNSFQVNCEMFYQKCRYSTYFYISDIQCNKITVGCISRSKADFYDNIDPFWDFAELRVSDVRCEEISLHITRTLLRRSYNRDYISDDNYILEKFDLYDLIKNPI